MRNSADVPGVTLFTDLPNGLVTDPDVGERAGKRAQPGTHRHSQQWHENSNPNTMTQSHTPAE
jgi:hypothetical protein